MYAYAPQPPMMQTAPLYRATPAPAPAVAVTALVVSIIIFALALLASPVTVIFSAAMGATATDPTSHYTNADLVASAVIAFLPLGISGILGMLCCFVPHLSMGASEFRGSGVKTASTVFLFLHLAFVAAAALFALWPLTALS